jgi:hypothetical protein
MTVPGHLLCERGPRAGDVTNAGSTDDAAAFQAALDAGFAGKHSGRKHTFRRLARDFER